MTPEAHRSALPRAGGEPPLEGVLLDAGLTLIHERTPATEVAAEVLDALGVPHAPDALARAMATSMRHVASRWHHGDWWWSEDRVLALFTDGYREGLAHLPALARDEALRARVARGIHDAYVDARHWRAFDDVVPALAALHEAGIPMGVVSDWGHGLEAILLELELGRYLGFVLVSARIGIGKPDPAVFRMALARLGSRAERTVYVGDTYIKDVFGARAAGLVPLLLDRRGELPAMDCAVARDLREATAALGVPAGGAPFERIPEARPGVEHPRWNGGATSASPAPTLPSSGAHGRRAP